MFCSTSLGPIGPEKFPFGDQKKKKKLGTPKI